jgi:hypothetical protein
MKYSVAAVLAIAASVSASYNQTIVYTTKVVDSYVTVCPASATITYQGVTYTNTLTESSTITITNCPCTVSAPVYTTSSVAVPTTAPAAPVYPTANGTLPAPVPTSEAAGTTYVPVTPPTTVPVSGAASVQGSLAIVAAAGFAAYFL